jgi:hypothetical protein
MTVIFTRIATPVPGKQSDALKYVKARRDAVNKKFAADARVYLRFGGPAGQILAVETFADLDAVLKLKQEVAAATDAGHFGVVPSGVFESIEEHVWVSTGD